MRWRFGLLVFVFLGAFVLWKAIVNTPDAVFAQLEQQTLPELPAQQTQDPLLPTTIAELEAATDAYFLAVETYRAQETRFSLARDQYYQLNTLAALDEAIRHSREVLRARADVLQSYFRYLRLTLQTTRGIDLDDKSAADAELANWDAVFEQYKGRISAANNREQINAMFEELNARGREVQSTAYSTLILIKIGEMQIAIDTSGLLQEKTRQALDQSQAITAAEKEIALRGLDEITTLLQRANNNNFTLREDFRTQRTRGDFTESHYRSFQTNAEFTYLQLRQVVDYLREIHKNL